MPTPQVGGMMDHDKMLADMKAADARLEALAQTMTSARGDDKVAAMQALLTELVKNHVDMHRHMAMMHDHMMSQMPHK
jgi:L-2-hydroxyglutarate oxidase LhgO